MIKKIPCNKANYNTRVKRSHSSVKFIVIHYTAGTKDTAENEGNAFKNHVAKASAHFFIGRDGHIVKSVPMDRIAWSVGGKKYSDCSKTGGGKFYGIATNANSVSIELCAIADKDPSEEQIKATVKCIKYIRKYCKNADYIIRHFDVNGKRCPARMTDADASGRKRWLELKARLYKDAGLDKK